MKYTMKDVAKACKTSVATVSMVLSGNDKRISEETKELVKETATVQENILNQ